MPSTKKLLQAAAGSAGSDPLYVEDVFSTYIYMGNDGTNQIINGIDLSGEGGMVWQKARSTYVADHLLTDSVRGINGIIKANTTAAQVTANSTHFQSWNNNGFTLGSGFTAYENFSGIVDGIVSWSFRKAENFFTMVKFTADATFDVIQHDLGSMPGFVIYKCLTSTTGPTAGSWQCWHSSLNNNDSLVLNTTAAKVSSAGYIGDVTSTQCQFYCASGETYIAYYFGNNQAEFGADSDESIIKCGTYNGTGSNGNAITLGFEPQWLLWKPSSASGDWQIVDSMRGWTADGVASRLEPNTSDVEAQSGSPYCTLTSTGFIQSGSSGSNNASGTTYIYMAIRRPMKTPEAGTEVFAPVGATTTAPLWKSSFPVDAGWYRYITGTSAGTYLGSRLAGTGRLESSSDAAQATDTTFKWDYQNGWFNNSFSDTNYVGYNFKRASGFMDVVAYTGSNNSGQNVSHNLTVIPEMMMFKPRNGSGDWIVYHKDIALNRFAFLNQNYAGGTSSGYINSTRPTDAVFTVGSEAGINGPYNFINYLFATLAGVSKVGSYTGNAGYAVNVPCGFSGGARFILIKRIDATGDWYLWDSFRGISAGNDPYFLMNTTAAQVTNTDYIDPLSSGFTVTSSAPAGLNASSGTYIFLAIA